MTQTAIPCTIMRGGTSKGLYLLARDLPDDTATRDAVLLAAMGSPDPRQIDGMGGAHPLTSKIAVVGPSSHPDADVDYLFLQAVVDEARIDTGQNCGNLLAGVGQFAVEEGLVPATNGETRVRIHMLNTQSLAMAAIQTPGGQVRYDGDARIDGVPGTAAPVPIDFLDVAGSTCGALLPTGNVRDIVQGIELTAVDNGMPVVVIRAADLGQTGYETPEALEGDADLRARIEAIRLEIGPRMNLGDVSRKTVPKMCLIAPPRNGGAVCTRNFIPHRVHEAIGVFGAVSVATACVLPGSVAEGVAQVADPSSIDVEHPTGFFTVAMDVEVADGTVNVRRAALLRTARRLMRGEVYVPASLWGGPRPIWDEGKSRL
ncbi:MAG: 4-oxalomesaconate tautomerase [Phenylobacterium sp.]|nr:4-oxalomesaconate tautomerase [Phenylobacterium sp.]